jgi:endonuclease YncB( thermonuclease family)
MNFLFGNKIKLNLSDYNINNTDNFSLNELFIETRIVSIYDGDTCTCILPIDKKFYKFNVRLAEIDTCEMTSKNINNKQIALEARKRLCQLISSDFNDMDLNITKKDLIEKLNKKCYIIKIKCGEFDKYGRLLAWLYSKDSIATISVEQSFNHILIKEKLAYKYEGKTKLSEEKQIEIMNI